MSRRRQLTIAGGLLLVLVLVAGGAWWLDARTKPEGVGARFVDRLNARHPGATVDGVDGGGVRIALSSGISIDVRISRLFDRCHADRLSCGGALDQALDDVDRAASSTTAPQLSQLVPAVTNEGAGYQSGYLADPLVASFEVRYALSSGLASTFVTRTIANRLGLSAPDALRQAALARLRTEKSDVEPLTESGVPVFRVRSDGDPAAALLDDDRMKRFALTIGSRRLYAIVPTRDALVIAAASASSAKALDALKGRLRGKDATAPDGGLLAYDVDASEGQRLSVADPAAATP